MNLHRQSRRLEVGENTVQSNIAGLGWVTPANEVIIRPSNGAISKITGLSTDLAATFAATLCSGQNIAGIESQRGVLPTATLVGQASEALVGVDLNGDGSTDAAEIIGGAGTATLFASDGSVLSTHHFTVASTTGFLSAGDFNGDGKQDLVISTHNDGAGTGSVSILLGNGDGTFQTSKDFAVRGTPYALAVADFNADGKLDVAVTDDILNQVWVLLGNGDGTLQTPVSYSTGNFPGSIVAADFNHDGKLDLAICNYKSANISMLLGQGDGTFQTALNSPGGDAGNQGYGYLAFADLNHDGNLDLAVAYEFTNAIAMLMGNGDGAFKPAKNYVTGNLPNFLSIIPLGDGSFYLFTSDDVTQALIFQWNPGDGTLILPQLFPGGQRLVSAAAADLNGDQVPDVIVYDPDASTVNVLLSTASGLAAPTQYPIPNSGNVLASQPQALAAADLNNDGKPDVVVARGTLNVLLGNGDGTLGNSTAFSAGVSPIAVALADLNGDGKPDAAVANSGGVSVLFGKGDGAFGTAATYLAGSPGPSSLTAGDFNGDGKPDLAVATPAVPNSNTASGNVTILLNNGDGTFRTGAVNQVGPTPGRPIEVVTGDLDGDGKLDLVVAYAAIQGVNFGIAVLFGNGDGTFHAGPVMTLSTVEAEPVSVAISDVDGDGKLDLIVAYCCGESDGTYFLGNGDGTFKAETHTLSGLSPVAVAVTDFGADGQPDLVFAGQDGYVVPLGNQFPRLAITPGNPILAPSQTQQFTVTGYFGTNAAVTWSLSPQVGTISQAGLYTAPALVDVQQIVTVTATSVSNLSFTASATVVLATAHPAFFSGENSLGSAVYSLQFPDANPFGFYSYVSGSILYHYDMGFEAFVPGSGADAYLYDFTSSHWLYTSSTLFPYLYDFTLNNWLYYFPDTKNPGHYTSGPRYFSNLTTGKVFTM